MIITADEPTHPFKSTAKLSYTPSDRPVIIKSPFISVVIEFGPTGEPFKLYVKLYVVFAVKPEIVMVPSTVPHPEGSIGLPTLNTGTPGSDRT